MNVTFDIQPAIQSNVGWNISTEITSEWKPTSSCFQQRYTYPYYDRKTFALKQLYVFTLHDCLSEKSLQGWMEKLDVFWMLFIKTFSTYSRSQNFLLLNIFNLTTMIWTELYWIPCLSCKRFRKILVTGKDKKWVLVFAVFKY